MISKVFEKLVNNRIVDQLEKCGLFSDFQCRFLNQSSRSTADISTVLIELLRLLIGLGLLELHDLVYPPRFSTGLGMLVFFTNLSLMKFWLRYLALFCLFSVIDGFKWFWWEHPVNAGVLQDSISGPTLFLLYINDLPEDVVCNIVIYADDTSLYSKCVIRHLICGNN